MLNHIITILLIVLLTGPTFCQSNLTHSGHNFSKAKSIKYDASNGLDFGQIDDMVYDDYGWMWLSGKKVDVTYNSFKYDQAILQRFDGRVFQSFPIGSKSDGYVSTHNLSKLADGSFIVSVSKKNSQFSLLNFDPKTQTSIPLRFPNGEIEQNYISPLFADENGICLAIEYEGRLHIYHLNEELKFREFGVLTNKKENSYYVNKIITYDSHVLVSDYRIGINVIDKEKGFIKRFENEVFENLNDGALGHFHINSWLSTSTGDYFNIQDRIYRYDKIKYEFAVLPIKNSISIFDQIVFSIGPIGSLDKNEFIKYQNVIDRFARPFTNRKLIFIDRHNNCIWISEKNTITNISLDNNSVRHFLQDKSVRSIKEYDTGKYLVATELGWYDIDVINNTTTPHILRHNNRQFEVHHNRGFLEFENLTMSNYVNGMMIYDDDNEVILSRHYPVESMCQCDDSTFYYGTFDYNLMQFDPINLDNIKLLKTDSLWIIDLECVGDIIYAATDKGLLVYNKLDKSSSFYKNKISQSNYFLMIDYIPGIGIITGSKSGELLKWDTNSFQSTIVYQDKLNAGIATVLLQDSIMWINTFKGIVQKNLNSHELKRFTTHDGLVHNECNRYSGIVTSDNGLMIGTVSGLNYIPSGSEFIHSKELSIKLISLEIYNTATNRNEINYDFEHINSISKIVLPANHHHFNIEFALDDILKAHDYTYQYKFDNDEWKKIRNSSEIRFNSISAGKHILAISAIDKIGRKITKNLNLEIRSIAVFYKRWWFITLFLLSGTLLVYLWFRRLKQERDKLEILVKERTKDIAKDKKTIEIQANELSKIDKLKNRFFVNISHEFRTPLTLILAPIRKLLKSEDISLNVKNQLNIIKRNAEILSNQVDEVLALTTLQQGKYKTILSVTNVYTLVSDVVQSHYVMANQMGIKLIQHCDNNMTTSLLDYKSLKKIINNLLSNALKYTNEGGRVIVSCEVTEELIRIEVRDTGVGISTEDQKRIFDRYFQTSEANKEVLGGTGIGLALVHELVDLMKGEISLESVVGEGSTFSVSIPASIVHEDMPSLHKTNFGTVINPIEHLDSYENHSSTSIKEIQNNVPKNNNTNDYIIMVVEDNNDLRIFLLEGLREEYTTISCKNGEEAWECITSGQDLPDLILSDVMMPRMDGMQLLNTVKSISEFAKIPFLLLTAKVGMEHKLDALRIGVDDYMSKPFDPEELHLRIRNLIYFSTERKTVEKEGTIIAIKDVNWLSTVESLCRENINNPLMSVDFIAKKMEIGRSKFYILLKQETGLTPNKYLREIRLQIAKDMLSTLDQSVKNVAHHIGMQDVDYFSKLYKNRFGKSPSD